MLKEPMKIYIAGPVRGVADYKQNFADARKKIEDLGHIVLEPSTLPGGMRQADYMRICVAMLQSVSAMVLLPGWENSEGAGIERAYAKMTGLDVYTLEDFLEMEEVLAEYRKKTGKDGTDGTD